LFTFNNQLWSADTNLNTGIVSDASNITDVYQLLTNGNKLFFSGFEYATGNELYEGDASVAAIKKISEAQNVFAVNSFDATVTPNPVTSDATLLLSGDIKNARIELTDMNGEVIWTASINNTNRINIPAQKLSAGMYLVHITMGDKTKNLKLIKQ
jgi:hypothetical protein